MRTAIVSDLHLGSLSGRDLLRDPEVRAVLFEALAQADRVVLLGDVLELFELPSQRALAKAKPFFTGLGETMAGRPVLMVPGNHDHRRRRCVPAAVCRTPVRGLAGLRADGRRAGNPRLCGVPSQEVQINQETS